ASDAPFPPPSAAQARPAISAGRAQNQSLWPRKFKTAITLQAARPAACCKPCLIGNISAGHSGSCPIGNISAGATSGSCPIDNIFAGVAFQSARRTLPPIRQVGLWQSLEMTGKRVLVRSEMLAVFQEFKDLRASQLTEGTSRLRRVL